jgi:Domain of unknown function (DUF4159)/Aerotolerance regulator N-terminal
MSGLLTFGAPLVLAGLVLLPIIWWLLRVTPPRPELEIFPPLKILAKVLKNETTPRKTPWWLLALRMLLAASIIFALADPVLNPTTRLSKTDGPLVLIVDNGWTSQRLVEAQMRTAESLLREAADNNQTVFVSALLQEPNTQIGPFDSATARQFLAAIKPVAATTDKKSAIANLVSIIPENTTIAVLSDGVAIKDDAIAFKQLEKSKPASVLWFAASEVPFVAINNVTNQTAALEIEVERFGTRATPVTVTAFDEKGRRVGEATAGFGPGSLSTVIKLTAPFELRNDIQSLTIQGERYAGATFVMDDDLKRKRIAILSGGEDDQANPILASTYYVRKALEPFADIVIPRDKELSAALTEALESRPSIIVMADIGVVPETDAPALEKWLQSGGVLIRFAGPRLAAAVQDQFLPVFLREGERALGGSMSWTVPQEIAEFSKTSPFATLPLPDDVTVKRQVLAEPDPDLARKTWASLTDGTPLVTADNRGKGTIVLFHVSPQATWSNLPISGSFVDMLRMVLSLSHTQSNSTADAQNVSLNPWRIISPTGNITPAPSYAKPAQFSAAKKPVPTFENPPGLYGNEDGAVALNLLVSGTKFEPATIPKLDVPVESRVYVTSENQSLKGIMLGLAALLLLLDGLAMIWMARGRHNSRGAILQKAAIAALAAFAILAAAPLDRSFAQSNDAKNGDAEAIEAISKTRLAFIKSGNAQTDQVTLEGLQGLTLFLKDKTALEPADPIGIDPEIDELAFYPLLYWPIDPDAPMPSPLALENVDAYMQAGGSVLFDTRDQGASSFSLADDTSPATVRLREILKNMNTPPLEPVPSDHVLTKSFYLLDDFPGRYKGSPLWVEQVLDTVSGQDRPVRTGDGVSPIMITGNDLASAWALTPDGLALYPTEGSDPNQRIMALRAGVNIVMYMLTGNYKSDQVHIPSLLERLGQ